MPADRHRVPSSFRRRTLVNSFVPVAVMRTCQNCEKANTPEKCKVGGSSDRCVECARKARSCDLAPFSPATWARVRRLREAKEKEVEETMARLQRLYREAGALKRREREIVKGELRNIEEVEVDEQAAGPSTNNFLFDLSSEQVELLMDFNWSGLVNTPGTVAAGSGSS